MLTFEKGTKGSVLMFDVPNGFFRTIDINVSLSKDIEAHSLGIHGGIDRSLGEYQYFVDEGQPWITPQFRKALDAVDSMGKSVIVWVSSDSNTQWFFVCE